MASGLLAAGDGSAVYNGFTFSSAVHAERIEGVPEYDEARRTIAWITWTITLCDYLYSVPPATIDAQIRSACMKLESPGGAFTFTSNAFRTDFKINVPGGGRIKDVAWGPHPGPLVVEKLGNNYAAKITWTVEVRIPECTNARYENAPAILNYRWMVDKDPAGYSTRRVIGHIVIAQTRTSQRDRTLKHTADEYRGQLRPVTPAGFRPGRDSVILSADRNRLDFTFEDIQLPSANIPPPGCVQASASLRWQNEKPGNLMMHVGTLTAQYTMAPGVPASLAANWFYSLYVVRMAQVRADIKRANLWADQVPLLLPIAYECVDPDPYGPPKASFSVTVRTTTSLWTMLMAGCWDPVPNSDWQVWSKSLADTAFNPRGQAGLWFNPADDAIIDLCNGVADAKLRRQQPVPTVIRSAGGGLPVVGDVTPINSWLLYECGLQIIEEHNNALHRPIPETSKMVGNKKFDEGQTFSRLKTPNLVDQANPFAGKLSSGFAPGTADGTPQKAVVQILNTPTYYAVLTGRAVRAGYPIQPPNLVKCGGAIAIPMNDPDKGDGFVTAITGHVGVPLYSAAWQLRFVLTSPPDDVIAPPHPYFAPQGGDKTTSALAQPVGQPTSPPAQSTQPINQTPRKEL
jgi:hypothetical protein